MSIMFITPYINEMTIHKCIQIYLVSTVILTEIIFSNNLMVSLVIGKYDSRVY